MKGSDPKKDNQLVKMLYDPFLMQCLLASSGILFVGSVVLLFHLCRNRPKEPVVDVEQVDPDVDVEQPILRPRRKTPRAIFLEEYFTHHKLTRLQLETAKQEWRNLSYEEKRYYEQLAYQHPAYQHQAYQQHQQ